MSRSLSIDTNLTDHVVVGAAAEACGFKVKQISDSGENEFSVKRDYRGGRQNCCIVVQNAHGGEVGFTRKNDGSLAAIGYDGMDVGDDLVNRVVRAATLLSGIQMQKKLGKKVQTEVNLNPANVNAEVSVVMYDYA